MDLDDVLAHVHLIQRGLIRVDADEATYPLHVILRFEIEQELIEGSIAPRDVPDIWNTKMTEYLGLSTKGNMKDGPMQDVHWPSGAFGYFPSYTLGAMIAAQLWAALKRTIRRPAWIWPMAVSSRSTSGEATRSGPKHPSIRPLTFWSARPAKSSRRNISKSTSGSVT